jgi:hypothetical protein
MCPDNFIVVDEAAASASESESVAAWSEPAYGDEEEDALEKEGEVVDGAIGGEGGEGQEKDANTQGQEEWIAAANGEPDTPEVVEEIRIGAGVPPTTTTTSTTTTATAVVGLAATPTPDPPAGAGHAADAADAVTVAAASTATDSTSMVALAPAPAAAAAGSVDVHSMLNATGKDSWDFAKLSLSKQGKVAQMRKQASNPNPLPLPLPLPMLLPLPLPPTATVTGRNTPHHVLAQTQAVLRV